MTYDSPLAKARRAAGERPPAAAWRSRRSGASRGKAPLAAGRGAIQPPPRVFHSRFSIQGYPRHTTRRLNASAARGQAPRHSVLDAARRSPIFVAENIDDYRVGMLPLYIGLVCGRRATAYAVCRASDHIHHVAGSECCI
jgi:hypothetical protein